MDDPTNRAASNESPDEPGEPDEPERLWRDLTIWFEDIAARLERDLLSRTGLTAAEYQVLAILGHSRQHELDQAELREELRWSASRLSHQLRRMRARGFCTGAELGHGTRMRIALTAEGENAYRSARDVHENAVREHLLNTISDRHRTELHRAVHRGRSRMRSE